MGQSAQVEWHRHPEAEAYVLDCLDRFRAEMPLLRHLVATLRAATGSRVVDWVDHLILADGDQPQGQLAGLGFAVEEVPVRRGDVVYFHPGAILPRVLLRAGTDAAPGTVLALAIQVEDISHFQMAYRIASAIEGTPLGPYRSALAWQAEGREILVVERRGHAGFVPVDMPPDYPEQYLKAFERWATRPRAFEDELEGMQRSLRLAQSLVGALGTDTAAWVAFAAERVYWQQRNRAGQVQKERQDSLGLGWANHDHHTFRSSRTAFPLLIRTLETFGFQPRERFYAGAQAGWGAQVMEQPACRFAVFADVDLAPDEVEGDFAHQVLPPRGELGTVGLWCALHGESMLQAGLHHLATRLDFNRATSGLDAWGIQMMRPFSEFTYLRQAFTRGERWAVAPSRLDRLAASGQLDGQERARFSEEGAVGSHLENIQRGDGFKGFNQQTVSDIIRRTDPRAGVAG
jgi:hypothetical protein